MKNPKSLSSKKPPEPNDNHQLIADWMADTKPSLSALVAKLDEMIRGQLDAPRYAIKWGKAYYGSPKQGWCIELVAYDVSVNLVFLNGSRLKNPPELGGDTRYVKLRNMEELESPQILEWIKQSCKVPGWAW